MLTAEESRMLAKIKQIALQNKDYKIIKLLSNISKTQQIPKEIKEYILKNS